VKKYLFSNEKKFQPDLTSFDPSKKLSAKIASTISQNVAKMLKVTLHALSEKSFVGKYQKPENQ
jgi:hypothetical protein